MVNQMKSSRLSFLSIFKKCCLGCGGLLRKGAIATVLGAALTIAHAATPVDLDAQKNLTELVQMDAASKVSTPGGGKVLKAATSLLKEKKAELDTKHHVLHIRAQQYYSVVVNGEREYFPIRGADFGVHQRGVSAKTTLGELLAIAAKGKESLNNIVLSGRLYKDLDSDLVNSNVVKLEDNESVAQQVAQEALQEKYGNNAQITKQQSELIVDPTLGEKAQFIFKMQFSVSVNGQLAALPVVLLSDIDTTHPKVVKLWDNLQREFSTAVQISGYGGNATTGLLNYKLPGLRDDSASTCELGNDQVVVAQWEGKALSPYLYSTVSFSCSTLINGYYEDGNLEGNVSKGYYSPANDVLAAVLGTAQMYESVYGQSDLLNTIVGQQLPLVVHSEFYYGLFRSTDLNAAWVPTEKAIYFGDGQDVSGFYPLTSWDIAAHELSHAFTGYYSNLEYTGESGGMDESFSDMAAIASEFYNEFSDKDDVTTSEKENWIKEISDWVIGADVVKKGYDGSGTIRYLYDPTVDGSSIKSAKNYTDDLDVHESSGVYNYLFYTLATTWKNIEKAFALMMDANKYFWNETTDFSTGACGVLKAADDLGYSSSDKSDIADAFTKVGISTSGC